MRKNFLTAMAVATLIALSSCGGKQSAEAPVEDSTSVETVADSTTTATDEVSTGDLDAQLASKDAKAVLASVTSVKEHYAQLISEGKIEEAKAYAQKMKKYFDSHADELKTIASGDATILDMIQYVNNLPSDAKATAEEAKSYLKSVPTAVATSVANDAKNVASQTVEGVKGAANKAVTDTKNRVEQDANKAVENAKSRANKTVENANKKATDAVNKAAEKLLLH